MQQKKMFQVDEGDHQQQVLVSTGRQEAAGKKVKPRANHEWEGPPHQLVTYYSPMHSHFFSPTKQYSKKKPSLLPFLLPLLLRPDWSRHAQLWFCTEPDDGRFCAKPNPGHRCRWSEKVRSLSRTSSNPTTTFVRPISCLKIPFLIGCKPVEPCTIVQ